MREKKVLNNLSAVLFVILLFILSFKVGAIGGDLAYEMNNGYIGTIDTQYFKELLSFEMPLMDIVYNSGNVSFPGDIRNTVRMIFGIESNSPLSILNAESAIFRKYYADHYLKMAADGGKDEAAKEETPENEKVKEDDEKTGEEREEGNEGNQFREKASSICFEEEEKKDIERSETIEDGKITVHNETSYRIDKKMIDEMLKKPFEIEFDRKGPEVLIYHTHTTEAYLRTIDDLNKEVAARIRDERYSVVRVGDELTRLLENKYGIDVIHNGTIHDWPDFNKSYLNAAGTVTKYLKSYPSIKIAIDIHRDAVGNGSKLRVVKDVDGKDVARVMFVVGTDARGLEHPGWRENLKLAVKMQQKLNGYCPGLAKHIYISVNRYNQHLADGSLLIEVGGDGNLVEECLESCKYLAAALNDVINGK